MRNFDVYDFYFGTHLDLEKMKAEGKKILYHFCGSEVRQLSISQKDNPHAVVKFPDEEKIRENLKRLAQYSDACTIRDKELYDHVAPYFSRIWTIPRMVQLEEGEVVKKVGQDKPLIVHAPSDLTVKGSHRVIEVVEALKANYDFDFQLIYKMNHKRAMQLLNRADIVIDQLRIGTYGVLSIEAMMRGKIVLCYLTPQMEHEIGEKNPIINADMDNLQERLVYILERRDDWPFFAERSLDYAREIHSPEVVIDQLISVYEAL